MAARFFKALGVVLVAVAAFVVVWTSLPIGVWYRDGRPTRFGKLTNRTMGRFAAIGVPAAGMVTIEVPGRKSGRLTSTVAVKTPHQGREYFVSMLGEESDWVRNVRAAGGDVVLRHGGARRVHLAEVPVEERAPIIRAFLKIAPGGRPHIPVDRNAPVEEFAPFAAKHPVFVVESPRRSMREAPRRRILPGGEP